MFKINAMDVGATAPIEYKEVTADESYSVGETLKTSSGKVTKASGTDTPEYVCVGKINEGKLPCVRIQKYMEFSTVFSADPGEGVTISVGDKVTVSSDGLKATATKTSGVFMITALEKTAATGVGVHGRFGY